MAVALIHDPTNDRWHRTDILGCSRTSTIAVIDEADRREVDPGDWPEERCPNCTW